MKRDYVIAALLVFSIIPSLYGSEVRFWKESSREDLEKGTLHRVSLLASGGMSLSPKIKPWVERSQIERTPSFYWSQVVDSKGNLYIGTGNEGLLYRISQSGKESIFFKAEEYEITAMAIDKEDKIYAASSPKGRIYEIRKDGESRIFCELEERYIWDLLFDSHGNLFAATGERGIIYKISSSGHNEIFYDSTEPHIVSLAFDPSENLLAASEGHGIVYKISPDGEASILLDSGLKEVSSICVAPDGTIYAGALADLKKEAKRPHLLLRLQEQISEGELERRAAESTVEETAEKKFTALIEGFPLPEKEKALKRPQSVIFRIFSNGEVEEYIHFNKAKIFAMEVSPDGSLFVGTGEPAKLFKIEARNKTTLLFQWQESQVTSLLPMKGSRWSLLTSNPGQAYQISSELEPSGFFLSRPFDSGMTSDWGTISCHFEGKPGTGVTLFTRSGNSSHPNSEWSDWSSSYDPSSQKQITSPSARYIQWKAELKSADSRNTPILQSVTISYLQRNKPPDIASFTLLKPGQTLFLSKNDPENMTEKKRTIKKGEIGISWKASDPNEDTLLFILSYKRQREKEWKDLAKFTSASSYIWDHSQVPDGSYIVRLVVVDSPSNYHGEEKYADVISHPILIDHSPPQVSYQKRKEGPLLLCTVKAEDSMGTISRLLYSFDQKEWFPLSPLDRICDSPREIFEFSIEEEEEHNLFLKCLDNSFNETILEVK